MLLNKMEGTVVVAVMDGEGVKGLAAAMDESWGGRNASARTRR